MPLGFGKKDKEKDGELEKQKSSLFGGRSKSKAGSPAPSSANPYAAPPPSNGNPYVNKGPVNDPYAARSNSSLSQPPTSSFGNLTLNSEAVGPPPSYRGSSPQPPREKSPVPPGGYGGGQSRYTNQVSYGQNVGYGSNPYGGSAAGGGSSRAGGYGGLGRSNSQDTTNTDAGRNALFGDAAQRAAQQPPQQLPPGSGQDTSYTNSGGWGYGEGPPRELTAQEEEDQDVAAMKQEANEIRKATVTSSTNARRVGERAEQMARETLARLGQQGERIHNTEKNLDNSLLATAEGKRKAERLAHENRGMMHFRPHMPFTGKSRELQNQQAALERHQQKADMEEATRAAAYQSTQRHGQQQRDVNGRLIPETKQKDLVERSKYLIEADSDDEAEQDEDVIEDNREALVQNAKMLNQLANAMGKELDHQNKHIDQVTDKSRKVGEGIAVNTDRLNRIHRKG